MRVIKEVSGTSETPVIEVADHPRDRVSRLALAIGRRRAELYGLGESSDGLVGAQADREGEALDQADSIMLITELARMATSKELLAPEATVELADVGNAVHRAVPGDLLDGVATHAMAKVLKVFAGRALADREAQWRADEQSLSALEALGGIETQAGPGRALAA